MSATSYRKARIAARRKRIQEKLAAIRQGDTTGDSNAYTYLYRR
jgi:hypothetical protein